MVALVLIIVILLWVYSMRTTSIYSKNIYLDNNGTTKPHKAVVRAVANASYLGNASSSYAWDGKMKIDELKERMLAWTGSGGPGSGGATYDVVITSGASESNNFIIRGCVDAGNAAVPHVILSSIEHRTSIDCVKQLALEGRATYTLVDPDLYGNVSAESIAAAIRPETVLISVMSANNEIGNLIDTGSIAAVARERGIPFHTDAVQTFGKMPARMGELGISALSMSFHKMHGPPGLGALVIEKSLLERLPAQRKRRFGH